MHFLMGRVEDGTVAGQGLSAIETAVTFFIIPASLFVIITGLSWIASQPRKPKLESSITSIS